MAKSPAWQRSEGKSPNGRSERQRQGFLQCSEPKEAGAEGSPARGRRKA
jgi:hypothetical protein